MEDITNSNHNKAQAEKHKEKTYITELNTGHITVKFQKTKKTEQSDIQMKTKMKKQPKKQNLFCNQKQLQNSQVQ